ncbi:hypothetical protein B0H13DRAFT_1882134 [Mycena leptocephala]|nr:hypothetical protein B0H13DRAFT_1882134 [Mycena leptocephala]
MRARLFPATTRDPILRLPSICSRTFNCTIWSPRKQHTIIWLRFGVYPTTPLQLIFRHLNQSQRTLDGNFQCKQFNKNTDPDDVSLCAGKGYFPLESEYKEYLGKIPVSKEKSTCTYLKAVNKQDKSKFRNMAVTGTINCQCSHVFILSCVDLHHGERFANADTRG